MPQWGEWIRGVGESVNNTIDGVTSIARSTYRATHWIVTHPRVQSGAQFTAVQFIESARGVITAPLTAAKMLFYPQSRTLARHLFEYNVLYYALPVVVYHACLRAVAEDALSEENEEYLYLLDFLANAVFLRAAMNALLFNTTSTLSATKVELDGIPKNNQDSCGCPDGRILRATAMSPAYYAFDMLLLSNILGCLPMGPYLKAAYRSHVLGQSIIEGNYGEQCTVHRVEYFSTHNIESFAVGAVTLAMAELMTYLITYTGAESEFIRDAMIGMALPLMTLHFVNTARNPAVRKEPPFDMGFSTRILVDAARIRATKLILPLIQNPQQEGDLLKHLQSMLSSPAVSGLRRAAFYPSLRGGPDSLVEAGPINLLIKTNYTKGMKLIALVKWVAAHPVAAKAAVETYQSTYKTTEAWTPAWVSDLMRWAGFNSKEHLKMIVQILTSNPKRTQEIAADIEKLLRHANEFDPKDKKPVRVRWTPRTWWELVMPPKRIELPIISENYGEPPEETIDDLMKQFSCIAVSDEEESDEEVSNNKKEKEKKSEVNVLSAKKKAEANNSPISTLKTESDEEDNEVDKSDKTDNGWITVGLKVELDADWKFVEREDKDKDKDNDNDNDNEVPLITKFDELSITPMYIEEQAAYNSMNMLKKVPEDDSAIGSNEELDADWEFVECEDKDEDKDEDVPLVTQFAKLSITPMYTGQQAASGSMNLGENQQVTQDDSAISSNEELENLSQGISRLSLSANF